MKYKKMVVPNSFFYGVLTEGHRFTNFEITKGAPKGAKIVSIVMNSNKLGESEITFEHESFEEVGEGRELPYIELVMKKITKDG